MILLVTVSEFAASEVFALRQPCDPRECEKPTPKEEVKPAAPPPAATQPPTKAIPAEIAKPQPAAPKAVETKAAAGQPTSSKAIGSQKVPEPKTKTTIIPPPKEPAPKAEPIEPTPKEEVKPAAPPPAAIQPPTEAIPAEIAKPQPAAPKPVETKAAAGQPTSSKAIGSQKVPEPKTKTTIIPPPKEPAPKAEPIAKPQPAAPKPVEAKAAAGQPTSSKAIGKHVFEPKKCAEVCFSNSYPLGVFQEDERVASKGCGRALGGCTASAAPKIGVCRLNNNKDCKRTVQFPELWRLEAAAQAPEGAWVFTTREQKFTVSLKYFKESGQSVTMTVNVSVSKNRDCTISFGFLFREEFPCPPEAAAIRQWQTFKIMNDGKEYGVAQFTFELNGVAIPFNEKYTGMIKGSKPAIKPTGSVFFEEVVVNGLHGTTNIQAFPLHLNEGQFAYLLPEWFVRCGKLVEVPGWTHQCSLESAEYSNSFGAVRKPLPGLQAGHVHTNIPVKILQPLVQPGQGGIVLILNMKNKGCPSPGLLSVTMNFATSCLDPLKPSQSYAVSQACDAIECRLEEKPGLGKSTHLIGEEESGSQKVPEPKTKTTIIPPPKEPAPKAEPIVKKALAAPPLAAPAAPKPVEAKLAGKVPEPVAPQPPAEENAPESIEVSEPTSAEVPEATQPAAIKPPTTKKKVEKAVKKSVTLVATPPAAPAAPKPVEAMLAAEVPEPVAPQPPSEEEPAETRAVSEPTRTEVPEATQPAAVKSPTEAKKVAQEMSILLSDSLTACEGDSLKWLSMDIAVPAGCTIPSFASIQRLDDTPIPPKYLSSTDQATIHTWVKLHSTKGQSPSKVYANQRSKQTSRKIRFDLVEFSMDQGHNIMSPLNVVVTLPESCKTLTADDISFSFAYKHPDQEKYKSDCNPSTAPPEKGNGALLAGGLAAVGVILLGAAAAGGYKYYRSRSGSLVVTDTEVSMDMDQDWGISDFDLDSQSRYRNIPAQGEGESPMGWKQLAETDDSFVEG
eukprot:GHVQ01023590.1.p1 GENE.GHVQ01023590.1~~GHVQ01023590.1.p1  ORF type:complete len:1008 (-),score=158.47 GHVQ01023590.1:262-3285(-)